jgi:D-hydroxyproline dehydrogenase subunit alpha
MAEPRLDFEIVVVGAGPAGLAAACVAAENKQRVALVDETPWLGGQIWRGQQAMPSDRVAAGWIDRVARSGVTLLERTTIIAAPQPGLLLAEHEGQARQVRWQRLILCTGARELFLPFPGWTLPGVMGAGGLLSLSKHGWPVKNKRIVIAGTGPLLLAAAKGLRDHGAHIAGVVEQASGTRVARFAVSLCRRPGKLWQGFKLRLGLLDVPFVFGSWPVHAQGSEQVQRVLFSDGEKNWSIDCDILACGFGLVPNVELPLALGCELSNGFVRVDQWQTTSQPNVFCAGEPTGISGADCALVEGQVAGFAATNQQVRAETLFHERSSWHRFRQRLSEAFALRDELKTLATAETIVCRCEDVRLNQLRAFSNWREAKLHSRCGMGPCQGRVCGPGTKHLLGWDPDSVRPPISPARVSSLISS